MEETVAQPSLGPASPQRLVAHHLMRITCSSRKWFCRMSPRRGSVLAEHRAHRSERAWVRFFSTAVAVSMATCHGWTPLAMGWLQRLLEEHEATVLVLHLLQMLSALALLLGQLTSSGSRPPELHCHKGNKSPERGRCGKPPEAG